jgi:hypothetical protein
MFSVSQETRFRKRPRHRLVTNLFSHALLSPGSVIDRAGFRDRLFAGISKGAAFIARRAVAPIRLW